MKISELPTDAAPLGSDLSPFVDVSAGRTEVATYDNIAASVPFSGRYAASYVLPAGAGNADFLAAATAAKNGTRAAPHAWDRAGSIVIDIPAGTFTITEINGLLGDEATAQKATGLTFRGAGQGLTHIIFDPASSGALAFNDYWLQLRFEGISFFAADADLTFMQSYTTHNAQGYMFVDCAWHGFKYVFDLQGDNNNSEYVFISCLSANVQSDGAFLYTDTTLASDQFLNYWFYGCKHWLTKAPFIDMARGGHVHIYGLDASAFADGEASTTRHLFKLRGANHALGVQSFTTDSVRVEAKSAKAALLYSEWSGGTVTLTNTDWSSQSAVYTYENIIDIRYANVPGPIYRFSGGYLAGGVVVTYGNDDWAKPKSIVFEDITWDVAGSRYTPSEVVSYGSEPANNTRPPVRFVRCRSTANLGMSASYVPVWDAIIGLRGQMVNDAIERHLSVRAVNGAPWPVAAGVARVMLPVGAIITGMRAVLPAGETGSGTTPAYTLATTEGSPTTVVTLTAGATASAGFDTTATPTKPYHCSTRDKATLTITPSVMDQYTQGGLIILSGFW